MAGTYSIFSSAYAIFMQKTLSGIVDDSGDGMAENEVANDIMKVEPMDTQFEEWTSIGGPGLAKEKPEGEDVAMGYMHVGDVLRRYARTFGMQMVVTEEAVEDNQYPQVIKAARMCKGAIYNTRSFDAIALLVKGWDTTDSRFFCADGLPLFSASHTLPNGLTYSNTLNTLLGPGVPAIIAVWTAIRKLPGLDGIVQQYLKPTGIRCPVEQEPAWKAILGSSMEPTAGNFARINVVRTWNLEAKGISYWDNTATNWAMRTNAADQPVFKDRRKPRGRTWVDEAAGNMHFSCTDRHCIAVPDPRAYYGVQA